MGECRFQRIGGGGRSLKILLNGESYEIGSGTTVAELLNRLSLRKDQVAVECNRLLVRVAEQERQVLCEGDRLEVVQFVGGG